MDLFCQKYNEPVPGDKIQCRHLKDYCKFRTGCIVFFMSDSGTESEADKPEPQTEAPAPGSTESGY